VHLRRIVKQILIISIAYNVVAISASLCGFMSPLSAAISMPLSTLTLLLFTVVKLRATPGAAAASAPLVTQFSPLQGVAP